MKPHKHTLQLLLAAGLLAVLLYLILLTGIFGALDRTAYDYLSHKMADPKKLPVDVVLVLIDEATIKSVADKYGVRWPWPREFFAGLLSALEISGAKGIAVDLMFNEPSEDSRDLLLASYCAAIPDLILARHSSVMPVVFRPEVLSDAFNPEKSSAIVDFSPDQDGVIREYKIKGSLADKLLHGKSETSGRLKWYGGVNDIIHHRPELALSAYPYVEMGMSLLKKIDQSRIDTFDATLLHKVLGELKSKSSLQNLNGKIVFLGVNFAAGYDVKAVPVGKYEPGVLAHYTAFINAARNEFITHEMNFLGVRVSYTIGIALALALLVMGWYVTRFYYMVVSFLILLTTVILGCAYLFNQKLIFIEPSVPSAGLVLSLIIVTSRNWLLEFKKRRQMNDLFGNYVSPHVMEKLLSNPEALNFGGEIRELTVYFSDIAGFTEISEKMPPEKLIEAVNLYLGEMTDFIINNGGYLDKYIGDAIMGVFGAPQPDPDHAFSACIAALSSRDHLEVLSVKFKENYGVDIHARIGINTGLMIVGNVGATRKKNYTVLGDSVNLASRLEGAGKEFSTSILIGPATHAALHGRLVTRPIELLRVKGKHEPVMVHELVSRTLNEDPALEKFINNYTQGYELYRQRRFSEAKEQFSLARQIRPSDKMAQVYETRAEDYMKNPPPENWDGIFTMKTK